MNLGTQVYWFGSGNGLNADYDTIGTITAAPAVDPDGNIYAELVEVTWPDGETEVLSVDEISAAAKTGL